MKATNHTITTLVTLVLMLLLGQGALTSCRDKQHIKSLSEMLRDEKKMIDNFIEEQGMNVQEGVEEQREFDPNVWYKFPNGVYMQVIDKGVIEPITPEADGTLDYEKVKNNYEKALEWLSETYVMALNIIHYMHDKYAYESIEMALHDKEVYRTLGCGMSGLSIAADSLAAVKYAKVYPIYNKDAKTLEGHEYEYVEGADDDLIVGYRTEGEFPVYGNDDDRADDIAKWVVSTVMGQVKRLPVYRGAVPTQSILTITSNVEYGKNTGSFPSGHAKGTPYAPGANPENGMDSHGMLPSMFSVGKIDYNDALDGISLTNTITPDGLGRDEDERIGNLVGILDAGNGHGLYHANINVLRKETMEDAVEHPEKYPHLTVRVSGYAVNFVKLTKEQQLDVISRTFHQGAVVD